MTRTTTRTANEITYDFANTHAIAETILANTRELGGVRIGLLPMGLLFVDTTYQRPARHKVQKIASEFNDDKCGFLLVSYRETDSRFAIIDGGNRFEAAKLIGKTALPCQILTGLSVEEEAAVFAAQNDNRVRLTANDLLKAQAVAGDEIAIGFQRLCKEFGIKLYYDAGDTAGCLVCTNTARRCYAEDPNGLAWVFGMISKANWNSIRRGYAVYVIKSLFDVYRKHTAAGDLQDASVRLLDLMTAVAPQILLAKSTSVFIGHTRVEAMTSLFDCFLEGKLPHSAVAALEA